MNFVIFANARSGSTSMAKVLDASPDVNLSMETFHPKYSEWNPGERDYSETIKSPEDMGEALDDIFEKYNAMKVLKWQFSEEIYSVMLLRKGLKVINLSRRNVFDAALSSLIAQQTAIWQKEDEKTHEVKKLQPINVEKIREIIEYVDEINEFYAALLDKNKPKDHFDLFYEELFSEDNEQNIALIRKVTAFLGIGMPANKTIAKHMVPSSASICSKERYADIPNWEEIKSAFQQYID